MIDAYSTHFVIKHFFTQKQFKIPLVVRVGPEGGVVIIRILAKPNSNLLGSIPMFGLQMLCGVRIEQALELGKFVLFPGFPGRER